MTKSEENYAMPGSAEEEGKTNTELGEDQGNVMPESSDMPTRGMETDSATDEMPSQGMEHEAKVDEMPGGEMSHPAENEEMPGGGMSEGEALTVIDGFAGTSERSDFLFPPRPEESIKVTEFFAQPESIRAYSEILETICGATDDSQAVEQYDGTLGVTVPFVNGHQRPVGQLQWNDNLASIYSNPGTVSGVRWCTGTLISNDLFLAAGHCFDQTGGGWIRPNDNTSGSIIPSSEIATNMHINFNYQVDPSGTLRTEQSFPVLELVEYRLGSLDFAIVRLGGNPGAIFGTTAISSTDASEDDMVCIIGHPAGVPKRIEAGPVTDLHDSRIGYNDIDTLGGNSGSGIVRASDGRIVGVHTNGGCSRNDPSNDSSHNHGVRITSMIAQSATLQALTTSKSSSGPVVSWGPNRLDAFVTGTNSALYHKWWNGSSWGPSVTGYEHMGGRVLGSPEVVSWGQNRLDVFVIGTNSALYHKWWNGSSWGPSKTGYESMGGKILGQPKVVAWGPNRLDVFVTGTDSALYHKWWNGSSWGPSVTGYENLGGKIISDPEVVSWGPNRLDIFAVGTNSALYHKWWNGSTWGPSKTGWENLGGKIIGQPRVVSWGPNRLDIFVIGTDSALYHKWWNGSTWGPSKTGWEKMGGVIIDF